MSPQENANQSSSGRDAEAHVFHTVEVAAQLANVPQRLIILYFRHGLVDSVTSSENEPHFDDEAIRVVRRIQHLRSACGLNLAGIKLVLSLTAEVERLRTELRFHRQT